MDKQKYLNSIILNKSDNQFGGFDKSIQSIKLNFSFILYDKEFPNNKYDDYLNTKKAQEDIMIFLNGLKTREFKNRIELFSFIFNINHPRFKKCLGKFRRFSKKILELISINLEKSIIKNSESIYDLNIKQDGDLTYVTKEFKLDKDLNSGFLYQIFDIYYKVFYSQINKTKKNIDASGKVFYYFYDSESDEIPIFLLSENDYLLAKDGKIDKYNAYLNLVSLESILYNNQELNLQLKQNNIESLVDTFISYRNDRIDSKDSYKDIPILGGKIAVHFENDNELFYRAVALIGDNKKN